MRRFVTVTILGLVLAGCSAKGEPTTPVTVTETPAAVTVEKTVEAADTDDKTVEAGDSAMVAFACQGAVEVAEVLINNLGQQVLGYEKALADLPTMSAAEAEAARAELNEALASASADRESYNTVRDRCLNAE